MPLMILIALFLAPLNAQVMLTLDSQANAKLARSNEQLADMLNKLNESLNIYHNLLTNSQAELEEIKKANSTLASQRRFLNASQIRLMDIQPLLDKSALELEKLQALEKRLKDNIEKERLNKQSKRYYLKERCPYLSSVNNLDEAHNILEIQGKNSALFLLKDQATSSLLLQLDLLDSLKTLCEQALKDTHNQHFEENKRLEYNALMQADFKTYQTLRLKKFQNLLKKELETKEDALKAFLPLEKRLETLKSSFFSQGFCETESHSKKKSRSKSPKAKECLEPNLSHKHLQQRLQNALIKRDEELKNAKNNKDKQALILANYEHTLKTLSVEFLSELNQQMAFLNETMALNAKVLATLAKGHSKTSYPKPLNSNDERVFIKNIPLDLHGFPSLENFK
ncbi:hypothetical protein HCW_00840 [Helicobacter cetorum MIT 00-7128]|uniref:Periplasmic protein n=2 Tax=Helicobacter cetorum TaxID=138563 RepID=I0EKJ2_HELC0|nr:hypothetical protein HCW_00840 [Helicobacter cetorum MIT 00-7128]